MKLTTRAGFELPSAVSICCSSSYRGGGPYHRYDALGDHGAVEYAAAHALVLYAACHHGALRGVEAAHGAARDGDEEHREDGQRVVGMVVREGLRDLGHPSRVCEYADQNTYGHDEQRHAEDGVYAADEGVDGQQRRQNVVYEYYDRPERHRAEGPPAYGHRCEQTCGCGHEDRAHQHHQHQREEAHGLPHAAAEFVADDLGKAHAVLAYGYHAREVVVHRAAEDRSKDDPQICRRAEQDAHYRTEDGARAGDVEELYEVDLPCRHGDVVDAVAVGVAGGLACGVGAEDPLDKGAVEYVSENEGRKGRDKCYHGCGLMFL